MIVVDFTFLEALESLYTDEDIIGIATDEMLKSHCYISFVEDYKNNYLKFMRVHNDKQVTPYSIYMVSAEDFTKKWHLYFTMDSLVETINEVSKHKIEQ